MVSNVQTPHLSSFIIRYPVYGFPGEPVVKNLPDNEGDASDTVLVPGRLYSPRDHKDSDTTEHTHTHTVQVYKWSTFSLLR